MSSLLRDSLVWRARWSTSMGYCAGMLAHLDPRLGMVREYDTIETMSNDYVLIFLKNTGATTKWVAPTPPPTKWVAPTPPHLITVTGECSVPHRYPGMMKIHEDPRQQNRLNLAGPMCRDTCTSNSDDGFSSPWGRSWSCCTVWLRAAPQEWVVPLLGVQNDYTPWQHYKMGCHWVHKTILAHESPTKWVA